MFYLAGQENATFRSHTDYQHSAHQSHHSYPQLNSGDARIFDDALAE
jgi:hypothetical protein